MPHSMTGFARQQASFDWGSLSWEIRSVNHRYLELHFRLPEGQRELEIKLRERLRKRLQRGKLDISLQLDLAASNHSSELAIDFERVRQLASASQQIGDQLVDCAAVNPLDILKWPGVLQNPERDEQQLQQDALQTFENALEQLLAHRQREGKELQAFIEQRLNAIAQQVSQVRTLMPKILQAQRAKLHERLAELKQELDDERLEQEMVILAQKADVDEELDRLGAHISEVRHSLQQSGAIGRRLDFLMQELNREANTLSSKSIVSETTQAAVELKVLIEQMREQIQNIE